MALNVFVYLLYYIIWFFRLSFSFLFFFSFCESVTLVNELFLNYEKNAFSYSLGIFIFRGLSN